MLDDNYLMLGPKVDLDKVEKISTKKLASFLNFFVSQTVSFLNTFASSCEEKLSKIDAKMQDIETLLVILESKISSVPGLDTLKTPPNPALMAPNTENKEVSNSENATEKKDEDSDKMDEIQVSESENVCEGGVANKDNPLYKRYFGMLKVGIPLEAVKQKMVLEQMDPAILEKPNELAVALAEAEE